MATSVTSSGVSQLIENNGSKPSLQVLDLEKMSETRYKCNLFDGKATMAAVVTTSGCPCFADGSLEEFGVISVDGYNLVKHESGDKLMVLEAKLVEKSLGKKLAEDASPGVGEKRKSMSSSPPSGAKPMAKRMGAGSRRVQPIAQLNPYNSGWTIKARVTMKQPEIKCFTMRSGQPGKVFNFEVVDEHATEIRITAWHEMAERLHRDLEVGKTYFISRGQLKMANKQYRTCENDYEMTLETSSTVEECADEIELKLTYNFVAFESLGAQIEKKTPFDVVGVVQSVGDLGSVTRKSDGGQLMRRDITLVDATARTVTLTIWNKAAEVEGEQLKAATSTVVLAAKGVRASDYNGVSLSTLGKTVLSLNPELPEAAALREWYDVNGGSAAPTTSAGAGLASARSPGSRSNKVSTLEEIQPEALAPVNAPPEWHTVSAVLSRFSTKSSMWYTACPQPGCNKKVTEEGSQWYCEAHQQAFDTCERRYIAQVQVMDPSGTAWMATFNEQAVTMIGQSADELSTVKDYSEEKFNQLLKSKLWQPFTMRVKSKTDEYNNETRRRITVNTIYPMDYAAESRRLLAAIQAM